jgi:hypothetical protein
LTTFPKANMLSLFRRLLGGGSENTGGSEKPGVSAKKQLLTQRYRRAARTSLCWFHNLGDRTVNNAVMHEELKNFISVVTLAAALQERRGFLSKAVVPAHLKLGRRAPRDDTGREPQKKILTALSLSGDRNTSHYF